MVVRRRPRRAAGRLARRLPAHGAPRAGAPGGEDAPAAGVATEDVSAEVPADEDVPAEYAVERNRQGFDEVAASAETATMPAVADGTLWDPLPVTLPTYVTKPAAARRTVRTIELGEPGAWTSGHTEESTAIAREADAAAASARDAGEEPERRAVGS